MQCAGRHKDISTGISEVWYRHDKRTSEPLAGSLEEKEETWKQMSTSTSQSESHSPHPRDLSNSAGEGANRAMAVDMQVKR